MQVQTNERRKYRRIATDQILSFAEIDSPGRLAVGKDVSSGGIRFEAVGCEINFGDVLRVTFNIGSRRVVATGRVAWATEADAFRTEVGLEFIDVDPRVIELLDEIIGGAELEPCP